VSSALQNDSARSVSALACSRVQIIGVLELQWSYAETYRDQGSGDQSPE
jgi:hypothetical protein